MSLSRYCDMIMDAKFRDSLDLSPAVMGSNPARVVPYPPNITVDAFNPASDAAKKVSGGVFGSRRRHCAVLSWDRWRVVGQRDKAIGSEQECGAKLQSPIPVPHPLDVVFVVLKREAHADDDHAKQLDEMKLRTRLR